MAETIRMKLKKSTQKWKNLRDKYFRLWREQKIDLSQERKPRTVKKRDSLFVYVVAGTAY